MQHKKTVKCEKCGQMYAPQGIAPHRKHCDGTPKPPRPVRPSEKRRSQERHPSRQIEIHQPIRTGVGARARRMIAKSTEPLPETFTVMPFITLMGPDGRLYLAEPMSSIIERIERT